MTPISKQDISNDELAEKIETLNQTVEQIKRAIIGDLSNDNAIGLAERVRRLENWIENRTWFERLVITGLVAEILGILVLGMKLIFMYSAPP